MAYQNPEGISNGHVVVPAVDYEKIKSFVLKIIEERISINADSGMKEIPRIKREVKEESGLVLNDFVYKGIVTFVSDDNFYEFMHLFWSDNFSGQIISCDEGELEWIPKSKMNELPQWQGDEIFLDFLTLKRFG